MGKTCTWDMFGIANHQGEPWTPQTWDTQNAAQEYLDQKRRDWPRGRRDSADPLRDHKVVPTSVTITIKD